MIDFKRTFITPKDTLMAALQTINASKVQVALVVDQEDRLLGTVTDGDVRRALLKDGDLSEPVENFMNVKPITASINDHPEAIFAMMRRKVIRHVPILDENGKVVDIEVLGKKSIMPKRDNIVVLMAGGLGTRLRPLTEIKPKPLLTVGGKPILETILESMVAHGFWRFYISVNYKADMIKDHFGDGSRWNVEISYLEEKDFCGTAGSLALINETPTEPLLLMNGDILSNVNFHRLLAFHEQNQSTATVAAYKHQSTIPFGVLEVQGETVTGLQEKPVSHHLINAGIYVLSPEAVNRIPENSEYNITDLLAELLKDGNKVTAFPIHEYWRDVGNHVEFEQANREFHDVFGDK